jgi:plastocyanin
MVTFSKRLHFRRAALCTAGLILAVAATASSAPAQGRGAHAVVTRVTVKMYEYRFALSVKKVPEGTIVFTIVNKGELPHTFAVQRLQKVSSLVQPGEQTVMRVTFRKPGTYYYLCTVGAHDQYGMHGNLTVTK